MSDGEVSATSAPGRLEWCPMRGAKQTTILNSLSCLTFAKRVVACSIIHQSALSDGLDSASAKLPPMSE
jgi:hypothetical protein